MQQLNISKGHAFMLVYRWVPSGWFAASLATERRRARPAESNRTYRTRPYLPTNSITSRQSLDVLVPIYQQIQELKGEHCGDGAASAGASWPQIHLPFSLDRVRPAPCRQLSELEPPFVCMQMIMRPLEGHSAP